MSTLTQLEQGEMHRILGAERATRVLAALNKKPDTNELTGQQDPSVSSSGKFLTQVEDPKNGGVKRLSIQELEKLRLDAQINVGLEMHKLPLLTLKPEFIHPDRTVQTFLNHELERVGYSSIARELLLALDYGFTVAERIYMVQDTTISIDGLAKTIRASVYERLKTIHPSAIEFATDANGKADGFKQIQGGYAHVPRDKAAVYTFGEEFGNRYGNALTRRAYKWWWVQDLIYQFTNRYYEDQSIPQRKIFYVPNIKLNDPNDPTKGTTDTNQQAALEVAEKSKSGAAVAFALEKQTSATGQFWGKATDMEFMDAPSRSGEFLPYLEHLDAKKLRAMLVPERLAQQTGSGATGSYGMLSSITDFFMLRLEGLAAELYRWLINEWAMPLVRYNFGSSVPAPTLSPPKLTSSNQALLSDLFKNTISSMDATGAVPEIDIEAIAKELGVPMIQNAVDDVTSQTETDLPPAAVAAIGKRRGVNTFLEMMDDKGDERPRVPGQRKAHHNRPWEKNTAEFQQLLGEKYTAWAANAIKRLEAEEPLEDVLQDLFRAIVREYRTAVPLAHGMGYSNPLTPDGILKMGQQLAKLEKKLETETIAKIGQRISAGLIDKLERNELAVLLQMQIGQITKPAGGDYWNTIVNGWADSRREKEKAGTAGKIRWVLDQNSTSCPDCPKLARVYNSLDELGTLPGAGDTACGPYCRCWLEEQDENGNWQRRVSDL